MGNLTSLYRVEDLSIRMQLGPYSRLKQSITASRGAKVINTIIDRTKQHLSKESLTILVADDSTTRRFIPEALIVAAILYIIHIYCDGFLKSTIGHMGEEHGKKVHQWVQDFTRKLRSDTVTKVDIDTAKEVVEAEVRQVQASLFGEAAQRAAESAVEKELYAAGAVREQAHDEAQKLSMIIQKP